MKDGETLIFRDYFFGEFHHITKVIEGKTKTYYIDGVVINSLWKKILLGMWVWYKKKQLKKFNTPL